MKAKIGKIQYFFTLPCLVYGKAIGITAGVIVRRIGSDVWTSMTIGFIVGIAVVMLTTALARKFPEKTIIEYSGELLGKPVGKAIGVILAIYFGLAFAVSVNVIGMHLKEYLLPQTPYMLLCAAYALVCFYGVWLGFEVVIRFAVFGFIMTLLINITMLLGTVVDFSIINLMPVLDQGIMANLGASIYLFSDIAMVVLGISMLYPYLENHKKIMPITFWSMVVAAITVLVWPFFETGVLGADVMKQFVVVCMQQVRSAQLTKYLPRYELIMITFFVWGVVVQSSFMLWCSAYSIKQVTKTKKEKYILIPLIVCLIISSYYLGRDHNNYIDFLAFPWMQISAGLSIGLPVLLFGISILRRKPRPKKQKAA